MGILFRKERGSLIFTKIGWISLVTVIIGLSSSFVDTIWAVYMHSFIDNIALIGFLSSFLTLVSFFSFFLIVPLIEKSSKSRLYFITLLLFGLCYVLFAVTHNFYLFLVLAIAVSILISLKITCFGIIVRDSSSEKHLSRNEGLNYTFLNLSWLIGPLVAGTLSARYGINFIFALSAVFVFIGLFIFRASKIKDVNKEKRMDKNVVKNFFEFFKSKNRVLAYLLGGGVNLWWVLIYLFMPLYIVKEGLGGLDIRWVGYFLFAAAVPLVLFEYFFADLAGKVGFKKIFKIGFFIPFLLSLMCFFVSNVYIVLLLIVLSSIGLSMLGATSESYFFDNLKEKQELRFYGPYNTTIDVNQFVGKIAASFVLLFLPFKFVFLLYSLFMLVMFLISFKIKNIVEKRRDGKPNK
ncbi:hypothetical protein A3K73_03975 [Candidatus Pacearchaeota archaeon RBG_13_36_9]|nr:MAG: hypothetical protein A3K73_03975 [Candidatus Pacearchaeota archaeon RBG_13_36_9]